VELRRPDQIAEAEALLAGRSHKILSGVLQRGDGGVNRPWSWHLDPSTVSFAEIAIELCDGCPSFVERDLEYWIGTVGRYCPWTTEVIARER
jgi:hypothetical protein